MVTDLIRATDLANAAVKELKTAAVEADAAHAARTEEAERFGIELANHVAAGQQVMERIAKITAVAQSTRPGLAGADRGFRRSDQAPVGAAAAFRTGTAEE